MDKAELQELLEAKLSAGATREQLHAHVRGQQKLIEYLAGSLAQLTTMTLNHKTAIEKIADIIFEPEVKSSLIGFEQPSLLVLGKPN